VVRFFYAHLQGGQSALKNPFRLGLDKSADTIFEPKIVSKKSLIGKGRFFTVVGWGFAKRFGASWPKAKQKL
jgi:hypothetical protein